jgi:hypothetical protein
MNINYTDNVKQWPEVYPLAQQATCELEATAGPSSSVVVGLWDRMKDEKGRDLLTLHLKDTDTLQEVSGRFGPEEFSSPPSMSFRLYRVWSDLLQARLQKLHERLSRRDDGNGSQN